MKKTSITFVIALVIGMMLAAAPVFAEGKNISIFVDGVPLVSEAKPVNKNGTIFVPFRALFEKMDMKVTYDSNTKRVTGSKTGIEISFVLNNKTATVNGKETVLQFAPFLLDNTTYIPLRFVGEATGNTVTWTGEANLVQIISPTFTGITYDFDNGSLTLNPDGTITVSDGSISNFVDPISRELAEMRAIQDLNGVKEECTGSQGKVYTDENGDTVHEFEYSCDKSSTKDSENKVSLTPDAVIEEEPNQMGEEEKKFWEGTNEAIEKLIWEEMTDALITDPWIDSDSLKEKAGISTGINDGIYSFRIYGPYDSEKGGHDQLFEFEVPKDWQDKPNHEEINYNGLRIKRVDKKINYFVEDLYRLNILPVDFNEKVKEYYNKRLKLLTSP